jgi:hypothetical protein
MKPSSRLQQNRRTAVVVLLLFPGGVSQIIPVVDDDSQIADLQELLARARRMLARERLASTGPRRRVAP